MNEVHVSSNAVIAVCMRIARDMFPNAAVTCTAQEKDSGMHVTLCFEGDCAADKIVLLRKAVFQSVEEYTGVRVACVMTRTCI